MNYLYFTEADLSSTAATGEGAMYPASATTTTMHF